MNGMSVVAWLLLGFMIVGGVVVGRYVAHRVSG